MSAIPVSATLAANGAVMLHLTCKYQLAYG
jgi:hypothetical protein